MYGHRRVPLRLSQFDDIGYQLSILSLDDKPLEALALPKKLYRILRPDENPEGIVAKDPYAQKTVLSHVNCGGRRNYNSQFISTSASLEVAKCYKRKGEENGLTGLRIGEFEVDKLPQTCQIVDLTTEDNREKYLGNAVCKNFAKASAEVLLQCSVPIPCTVIDPPSSLFTYCQGFRPPFELKLAEVLRQYSVPIPSTVIDPRPNLFTYGQGFRRSFVLPVTCY